MPPEDAVDAASLAKEAKAEDTVPEDTKPEDADLEHESLKYHLLGPSLTKAGQDSVDQFKVLSPSTTTWTSLHPGF